jgi:hypothetical protein
MTIVEEYPDIWFWPEIKRQFGIVVKREQRARLTTVGSVVSYLQRRVAKTLSRRSPEANG